MRAFEYALDRVISVDKLLFNLVYIRNSVYLEALAF